MNQSARLSRNAILGKIHVAKKQLSIPDEDYRALIANLTQGKTSCKDCTPTELGAIMDALVGLGFKPVSGKCGLGVSPSGAPFQDKPKVKLSPPASDTPTQADKIRAMWIDLYAKGIVKNRGDDALGKFVKRLTKVDRVEWLNQSQVVTVVAALSKMGEGV